MLHQEILFRFDEPEVILPRAHPGQGHDPAAAGEASDAVGPPSRAALIAAVCGNVLLGTLFLGALLLLPRLLAWWLTMG